MTRLRQSAQHGGAARPVRSRLIIAIRKMHISQGGLLLPSAIAIRLGSHVADAYRTQQVSEESEGILSACDEARCRRSTMKECKASGAGIRPAVWRKGTRSPMRYGPGSWFADGDDAEPSARKLCRVESLCCSHSPAADVCPCQPTRGEKQHAVRRT